MPKSVFFFFDRASTANTKEVRRQVGKKGRSAFASVACLTHSPTPPHPPGFLKRVTTLGRS